MTAAARIAGVLASTGFLLVAVVILVALRQPAVLGTGSTPTDALVVDASPITKTSPAIAVESQVPTLVPSCKDGVRYLASFDRVAETIEGESAAAEAVGLVRLTSISEGKLNPPRQDGPMLPSQFNRVFRSATFEVLQIAKGDSQQILVVRVFGGKYGCDSWEIAGYPEFVVGREYLVFAQKLVGPDGKPVAELTAASIWPVNAQGLVETKVDGLVTPAEALSRVR